jgi:hypothetical protein
MKSKNPCVKSESGTSLMDMREESNNGQNKIAGKFSKGMKLIPWQDIWTTLYEAKNRGDLAIIGIFFRLLLEQAVFDDQGAWCLTG